jgi:hypothetical protein
MQDKIKGKGSVGIAIAYYSLEGIISIPLEPCDYNLIYDDGVKLYKVKVISCSYKTKYGIFAASIRTSGGNQPSSSIKKFDQKSCDIVFIVTSEMDMYEIPAKEITSTRQISLNVYQHYKVSFIPS